MHHPFQHPSLAQLFLYTPMTQQCLICVTLARNPVCLAFAHNLLSEPLSLEAAVQYGQILDDILAASNDGLLRCDRAIGLDAELEGREKRVRYFVGGENDVFVLEQALRKEVAKSVVFLVECEDGGVGHTGFFLVLNLLLAVVQQEELESRDTSLALVSTQEPSSKLSSYDLPQLHSSTTKQTGCDANVLHVRYPVCLSEAVTLERQQVHRVQECASPRESFGSRSVRLSRPRATPKLAPATSHIHLGCFNEGMRMNVPVWRVHRVCSLLFSLVDPESVWRKLRICALDDRRWRRLIRSTRCTKARRCRMLGASTMKVPRWIHGLCRFLPPRRQFA
jgi:hypothetical protein